MLVSCKATPGIKYFGTLHTVAQPTDNSWRYAEDGLVIGLSLTAPDSRTHYLLVMKLSDAPRTLYEGARIGEVYPVTSLKQAHEMLPVDSQLSDWDSDSDDGVLLDVQTAAKTSAGTGKKLPHHNERLDALLDPKDLPEHLQPLMEWIAEDITPRERGELAAAIYEYRDLFSIGPAKMGRTDLVTLSIDTGEHRPI